MRKMPLIGYSRTKSGLIVSRAAAELHRNAVNQQSEISQPEKCKVIITNHKQEGPQIVFL